MNKIMRLNFLVYISLSILFGLIAIQFYLLCNTFTLHLRDYSSEVKSEVLSLESDPVFSKANKQYINILTASARELSLGKIESREFNNILLEKEKIVSTSIDSILMIKAKTNDILSGVEQITQYRSVKVQIFDNKTILNITNPQLDLNNGLGAKGKKLILLGTNSGTIEDTIRSYNLKITYTQLIYLQVPKLPDYILSEFIWIGTLCGLLILAVVIVFYNVFRQGQKQKKLGELRVDLINNITHEVKTPLTSMAIAFKTLSLIDSSKDREKHMELILNLEKQHGKLSETVERVLEASVNQEIVSKAQTDIIGLLDKYYKNYMSESNPLKISVPYGSCMVNGSSGLIEAIIDNLVENAQKYTPSGALIKIEGLRYQNYFRVDVIDSGDGIAEEYQKFLFEKFFRVPQKDEHAVKGLGLGLFLSRQAVVRIGGRIELSSSSESGTVFSLYLPLI